MTRAVEAAWSRMEWERDALRKGWTTMLTVSPEEALAYLDNAIRKWRENREDAVAHWAADDKIRADCYVDAFQSVRLSLFGELLPVEGTDGD